MTPRVLIIDDELRYASGLAELLRHRGVGSERATSVGAAIAAVDRWQPELATVDLMMPPDHDIEGLSLARQLHARKIRVLILTNRAEPDVLAAAAAVADRVVEKGVGGRKVVEVILTMLGGA